MKYQIKCHEHIFESEAFFPQCHASTLERLPNGDIVVAWFAGQHEKAPDVAIWFAAKTSAGWCQPRVIASHTGVPCWNPVLFYMPENCAAISWRNVGNQAAEPLSCDGQKLVLFYKVGKEIHTWQTMYKESFDNGETWTVAQALVPGDIGGRGPVKNKCIRLKSGTVLAPASVEDATGWDSFVDIYDGNDWHISAHVPRDASGFTGLGIIQPTLWEDDEGIVHMLTRSTEGCIYSSQSADGGETWATARKTKLPNNNCGIDVTRLEDGRLVLVYNPISGNWAARSPISFAISEDNGVTWSHPQILDYAPCDPNRNLEDAEFSYPAVISHGNDIFITYTWKRRTIAFWQISLPENKKDSGPIKDGVWVTMVTPFKKDGAVDYIALEQLINWYISKGIDGLFAVCQSSEMFFLSLEERAEIAGFVVEKAAGRVPVVVSGHVSDSINDQIAELTCIGNAGASALVLVSNRLADENEDDNIWKENARKILDALPNHVFGVYECPYPYKRLMSPELLKWCAETGRFAFLKDTSCSIKDIQAKLDAIKGTKLKLFNANTATILESLRAGANGFCGVMANFHPELYAWLIKNGPSHRQKAELVQNFATMAALIELQNYPANAKYHLNLRGVSMEHGVRKQLSTELTELQKMEVGTLLNSWSIFYNGLLQDTTPMF